MTSNGWTRVQYSGKQAYIKSDYLTTQKPAEEKQETQKKEETETQQTAGQTKSASSGTVYAVQGVNIREQASADSDIIGSLQTGESVARTSNDGEWSCITINGVKGYIKSDYLTTEKPASASGQKSQSAQTQKTETKKASAQKSQTSAESSITIEEVNDTVYATAGVNVRKSPDASSEKLGSISAGDSVMRTGKTSNGWTRVNAGGVTGYINSNYLTSQKPKVQASASTTAASTKSSTSSGKTSSNKASTTSTSSKSGGSGSAIASFGLQYVGYPYVYGGNSLTNGVDCSGFTQQVYLHFGYSIPRTAAAQSGVGTPVTVSTSTLQPGDLLFYGGGGYIGHVAMYIGNGQVVHASTPTKGIITSNYNYRTPVCARRII